MGKEEKETAKKEWKVKGREEMETAKREWEEIVRKVTEAIAQ